MRLQSCQIDGWFTDGFAIFIRSDCNDNENLKPIHILLFLDQHNWRKHKFLFIGNANLLQRQVINDQTQTPEIWEIGYQYLFSNANLILPNDRGIPKQIQLGNLIQLHPHSSQINLIWKFDPIASSLFSAKWQMVNEYKHEWINKPNET